MKIRKKIVIASLISLAITSAFADRITMNPSQSKMNQIEKWKFEKQDDGMIFILGLYIKKLLEIHSNQTVASGVAADLVKVVCNKVGENNFREHRLDPGMTITCKGNFNDMVSMYIAPEDFKHGAEGTFEYIPLKN